MKSFLLAAVLSVVGSGAVLAADLPMYNKAPAAAPAAYDWSGAYVGGHVGGEWGKASLVDPSSYNFFDLCCSNSGNAFVGGPAALSGSNSSFLGGLQAGANYQIGRLVLGAEFDYSWTNKSTSSASGSFAQNRGNTVFSSTETFGSSTHWIATATTRLGVARDTWLFYGKVGAAMTGGNYSLSDSAISTNNGYTFGPAGALSDRRTGWTVGTGIEWAFARNWTAKLEYDYMNFGTVAESIPFGGIDSNNHVHTTNLAVNVSQQISEVKFGINYKLDPGFLFW
jgi:outer membrane immunogenic protein